VKLCQRSGNHKIPFFQSLTFPEILFDHAITGLFGGLDNLNKNEGISGFFKKIE
jgi:hypothetical protein